MIGVTSEKEAHLLWLNAVELRKAIAEGDEETARQAREELEAIAMHSEHATVRRRAADAIGVSLPDGWHRAS